MTSKVISGSIESTPVRNPEISVIVPVYKVEKYLAECLDSIAAQDFKAWECILVDDGSPDGSGAICDEYARRDSRFVVIHQENAGLSAARNAGMRVARGRYFSFIDSDDWVAPNFLSTLLRLLVDNDADVSQVNLYFTDKKGDRPRRVPRDMTVFEGEDVLFELLVDTTVPSYACTKLFRREVATTGFPVGKNFEDIYAMTDWFQNVRRIAVSPEPLYFYRMRGSSISKSNYGKNQMDYFRNILRRGEMFHKLIPLRFNEKEYAVYLEKKAVTTARDIARYEIDPSASIAALDAIRTAMFEFPKTTLKDLGFKFWLRSRLLRSDAERFRDYVRLIQKSEPTYYRHPVNNNFE